MVAALYSSRIDGTKDFCKNKTTFGWSTVESVYKSDLYRAKHGVSRRVPGLKYAHIVRDSWTRLNVLPAKIMQVIKLMMILYLYIYIVHVHVQSKCTCTVHVQN